MKAIFVRRLSKRYWFYEKSPGFWGSIKNLFKNRKVFVDAIKGIDIDIETGEIIGFIGPNGAGKTTTLKILSGILYPTEGEVKVLGFLPFKREKRFLSQIAFISGQRNQLFWDLPAREYFNFCKTIYDIPEKNFKKNLDSLVEVLEIGNILDIPQRKLSFGQRKRCELAGALLHDPKVIFLDEPTNALDLINARKVREFIASKGKKEESTIILTSHNMSDIEQVCKRVVIINQGRIIFDGDMESLYRLNGFNKKMKILFDGQFKIENLKEMGRLINFDEREVLIEVPSEETSKVASKLFASYPIKDISIENPSLERIIESIYRKEVKSLPTQQE